VFSDNVERWQAQLNKARGRQDAAPHVAACHRAGMTAEYWYEREHRNYRGGRFCVSAPRLTWRKDGFHPQEGGYTYTRLSPTDFRSRRPGSPIATQVVCVKPQDADPEALARFLGRPRT
jgi:hypothetical protein